MQIHQLQPKTKRQSRKYIGRGGKKGTYSGKGTKGQKSRAGASVRPGFRGGDNRLWQLFPKKRGASKKPGNARPHPKHRFFMLRGSKPLILDLAIFDQFNEGQTVSPNLLKESGLINNLPRHGVKILGQGDLKKKLNFEGFKFSNSARDKVLNVGGTIK